MSSAMDKALMAMSLEEEDVPFNMPDLPIFSSCKENALSLVGRTLNPECQPMKNLVRNLPRKWQKLGRVRGVALSKEKFQFFFNSEHDLEEVLEKGIHTFNEWSLVVDRWYENPPDDYLQFTPIWIRIWNLPINYYTEKAITALGGQIGRVVEVAFDTTKSQIEDYVRVKVIFDVSRPLRRSKVVNLPKGGTANVFFEYERVQKRCYECQRMTHEKDFCPVLIKRRQDASDARRAGIAVVKQKKALVLSESDPLFGILHEDQVGMDPVTGRHRIAPEVLEGMRQYMRVSSEDERMLRADRVRSSVRDVEKDPLAAKSILRLEPRPIIHQDLNKNKGVVFDYSAPSDSVAFGNPYVNSVRALVGGSSSRVNSLGNLGFDSASYSLEDSGSFLALSQPFQNNPTVYGSNPFAVGSSGIVPKKVKTKSRGRPTKSVRKLKPLDPSGEGLQVVVSLGAVKGVKEKRKAVDEGTSTVKSTKLNSQEEMRKDHFPEVMFLMETKNGSNVLVDLQVWLGYEGVYTVNPVGLSGGLAVFWKKGVDIDVKFADKNLIDLHIQFGSVNFFVSCVYGAPVYSSSQLVWERLSRIGVQRLEPWCMLGDFNAILHNGEKLGGPRRGDASFLPFKDMLENCQMSELPGKGNPFTWGGKRNELWIQSKLDRCFGNKNWFRQFPVANQTFLDRRGSDHRAVLVRLTTTRDEYRGCFRFDKRLFNKPLVKEAISGAWNGPQVNGGFLVSNKLKMVRKALSRWKKENNLNSLTKIKKAQVDLELEQAASFPRFSVVKALKGDLSKAYKEEETFWSQKSRQQWMHGGDKNSKFFHASVKACRGKQFLEKLKDINGNFQKGEASKGAIAEAYFTELFTSGDQRNYQDLFSDFIPKVTPGMNAVLIAPVSKKEIRDAVFAVKGSSAPGADGFNGFFFQKYWCIIGNQVTYEVQQFFLTGILPKEWNYTQLCLLPKKGKAEQMSDLRPISLCSVLYKIISKVLVRRLQPFLADLVAPNQSAFVSERLISDNILIAHEVVHGLRTHKEISKEFIAIKSDMSKAYDRVEWGYLKALLEALGFHSKWVQWIMVAVSTVTFSVLINDQAFGLITPSRGIRQGDPLSPFLFVLCTEGLTHLMNKAERQGLISGIQFSPDGPAIHHLLFADDSLFMCKADRNEVATIKKIFQIYGDATGQKINFDKSSITFGAKVDIQCKGWIQSELGIMNEGGVGTYLGLPECFSGSKVQLLDFIKDKLKARLSGWFARTLSLGGKEVLLKAVAMAMPVYAMSCFKLTKTTCENLTSAMSEFWWSAVEHRRKVHWISWEKLCLSKNQGGLGFRDIESFNQALLGKQAWRLLQNPSSLFARFFKSRYFVGDDFLEADLGVRPSYAWRSILHGRELLIKGLRKEVGNGKSLSVWMDSWVYDNGPRIPLIKHFTVNLDLKVEDLIDHHARNWNREVLDDLFYPIDVELIVKRKPVVCMDDFWCWLHTKSGEYSVKTGYWLAFQINKPELIRVAQLQPSTNVLLDLIWASNTSPKIKIFLWRALSAALPVVDQILRRGMRVESICQTCGEEGESINHVLFTCSVARQIWALSGVPTPEFGFSKLSIFANIQFLFDTKKNLWIPPQVRSVFPWVLWRLWKNRNKMCFEGLRFCPLESVAKIIEDAEEWFVSQAQTIDEDAGQSLNMPLCVKKWDPPPLNWVKCNIGAAWSNKKQIGGCSWVVRDALGKVLLHSRRAFGGLQNRQEVLLQSITWAMDSMHSHKLNRVIFATEGGDLVSAFHRPKAWPSFSFQVSEIRNFLEKILESRLVEEKASANRGASLIALSIVREERLQSYVAVGHPHWLQHVFEEERISS
ncbi:hypothetical protein ISN45_Aa01g039400 [Arabidopsis thaliana x Arabidopsis arenosa]|uniref:Reverse transcriptase domain-containing protein n=1 Tax=Arabidopsis thaliana x Arabidopsis arenosa TaxID=1240361 RepID=A0A8T2CAT9_9BRAS|nr:hypothetical protein ISN45_Aa01g039400 [Arabidopsis thaliana x Arabidopsis arenosa]